MEWIKSWSLLNNVVLLANSMEMILIFGKKNCACFLSASKLVFCLMLSSTSFSECASFLHDFLLFPCKINFIALSTERKVTAKGGLNLRNSIKWFVCCFVRFTLAFFFLLSNYSKVNKLFISLCEMRRGNEPWVADIWRQLRELCVLKCGTLCCMLIKTSFVE